MRSVPSHFVDLCAPGMPLDERDAVMACGIVLGERVELDLEQVALLDSVLASELERYHAKVAAFWDAYVETGVGGECVVTRRTVSRFLKVDKKGCKLFLKDQVAALEELTSLGEPLGKLLGGDLNIEELKAAGMVVDVDGSRITASFEVEGKRDWPVALGGVPARGEIGRVFTLKVSHAPSHDRKAQRLLELKVEAKEIWPK